MGHQSTDFTTGKAIARTVADSLATKLALSSFLTTIQMPDICSPTANPSTNPTLHKACPRSLTRRLMGMMKATSTKFCQSKAYLQRQSSITTTPWKQHMATPSLSPTAQSPVYRDPPNAIKLHTSRWNSTNMTAAATLQGWIGSTVMLSQQQLQQDNCTMGTPK